MKHVFLFEVSVVPPLFMVVGAAHLHDLALTTPRASSRSTDPRSTATGAGYKHMPSNIVHCIHLEASKYSIQYILLVVSPRILHNGWPMRRVGPSNFNHDT